MEDVILFEMIVTVSFLIFSIIIKMKTCISPNLELALGALHIYIHKVNMYNNTTKIHKNTLHNNHTYTKPR